MRDAGKERASPREKEREFPGVRTKGATLDRLGGIRAERKRVVGTVKPCEESTREKSEK